MLDHDYFVMTHIKDKVYYYESTRSDRKFEIRTRPDSMTFFIWFPGSGFPVALEGVFTSVKAAEIELMKYFARNQKEARVAKKKEAA